MGNNTNTSCKNTIPTREEHFVRNDFNIFPSTKLTHYYIDGVGEIDEYKQKIYRDDFGGVWHELKWYHTMLHCPATNIKLVHYCCDEDPTKTSSSEIIIAKKKLETDQNTGNIVIHTPYIHHGSFNFKDFRKAGHWKHFLADILPPIIYCSCIGR